MRILHILLIILTLAAYTSPLINPAIFWPIAVLGLLAPVLWGLTLLFGIYWFYKKDNALWLNVITLILGWDIIGTAFAIPDGQQQTVEKTIQVISLNGYAFRGDNEEMASYFKKLQGDIICLQEFHGKRDRDDLIAKIKKATGLTQLYHDRNGGIAVFSRYPLKNGATHFFKNKVNGYLSVDVDGPDGVFRLFNLHLQTNAISHMANKVVTEGDLKKKKTWLTIKGMFGRYGRSSVNRTQQSQKILKEVQTSPYPVILCGDFNDVPASYLYRLYRTELQDAHLLQSWGLGATYAGVLPGLRIDYLMADTSFLVLDYKAYDCFFSDHQTIVGTLGLNWK